MQKLFALLALLFLILLMASPVLADGGVYIHHPDGWTTYPEKEQYAAINYENGYENMILTVGFDDLQDGTAVWIFPVPAKPEDTVISIIEDFPNYAGIDIKQSASRAAGDAFTVMRMTQPYMWPFALVMGATSIMGQGDMAMSAGESKTTYYNRTVTVYERLQKDGVTTELITAKNPDSLYSYLSLKGAELPQASKDVLGGYIGKDYSFVISWISDMAAYSQNTQSQQPQEYYYYDSTPAPKAVIGVSITFPTDKIYFPLKPTSVYGSSEVPATIYISSHVTPLTYPEIENSITTQYLTQNNFSTNGKDALTKFFNGKSSISGFDYTKVTLKVPSKYLKEDLWFSPSPPASVAAQSFVAKQSFAWGWLVLILLSGVSGLAAGMIVYRKDKPSAPKFLLFGLLNCLTLVPLIIVAFLLDVSKKIGGAKPLAKKAVPLSKMVMVLLAVPAVVTVLLVASFLLFSGVLTYTSYNSISYLFLSIGMLAAVVFVFFFFACAPIVFGYFRNRKALYFLILFSVLFMVLSFVAEIALRAAAGI